MAEGDDILFKAAHLLREPLAARMRPRTLDEYIGQDHIVGKGRLLRRAIAADQLSSVIFYGPPGSGKTTLARVIANHTKSNFITLNAVLTGVADIRGAIKQAEEYFNLYSRRTILFVDEVHRWNRAQQDALLPWVENGTIILIGATTENPFFEVNKALVSRSRVFQLKALTKDDLKKAAEQALSDTERGYGHWNVEFEKGALEHLVETASGDARSLLNALELAVETTSEKWDPGAEPPVPAWGSTIYISAETAEESIQKKVVLYDRDGDYHYDIISAFIKSLRGRDADAAMYWLARMVAAGEDANFIFRRMLISACEDTGLADPHAVTVVTSCAQAFDRVGMPEGRYFLAHAALYLATAPKSNSSMAFFDALASVEQEDAEVPNHLRDGNRDAEGFGHGEGYLYPHAYRDHWVAQQYLPDALIGRVFYTPSTQGYEKSIRDDVLSRRELQIAALLEREQIARTADDVMGTMRTVDALAAGNKENDSATTGTAGESAAGVTHDVLGEWWTHAHFARGKKSEQLTFSPKDTSKETALSRADKSWQARIDSNRAHVLLTLRDMLIELAELVRHHRSLVWNADDGLLLWEVMRRTPEGVTCGVCKTQEGKNILEQYCRTLGDLDKPFLQVCKEASSAALLTREIFSSLLLNFAYEGAVFDRLFFHNPFTSRNSIQALVGALDSVVHKKMTRGFAFTDDNTATENALSASEIVQSVFADAWRIVIAQRIPLGGQRISGIVKKHILTGTAIKPYEDLLCKMDNAETAFFSDKANPLFNWNMDTICDEFKNSGFSVKAFSQRFIEKRYITQGELAKWFDTQNSAYGSKMAEALGVKELEKIVRLLESACGNTVFDWENEVAFFVIEP
ncbi:MAG: AAA family ATPase [Treponema sp.]|nr:AAA family ATPase [Treponema sp.]